MSILWKQYVVSLLGTFIVFAGIHCASTSKSTTEEKGNGKEVDTGPLVKYEQEFNPADYNPSLAAIQQMMKADTIANSDEPGLVEATPPQTIAGFRIQVLSTTEIDSANAVRDRLSNLPQSIGIYVTYDSPYYKVRVGDFSSRPAANPLLKAMIDSGYSDAWIVPDRVSKNPRPRQIPPPPQDNPIK
jgi:hypothetical protein